MFYEFFLWKLILIRMSQNHRPCHHEIWQICSNLFYDETKIVKSYIHVTLEDYPSWQIWSRKLSLVPKYSKSRKFNSWNQSWKEGTFIILFVKFDLKYSHFIFSAIWKLEKQLHLYFCRELFFLSLFVKFFKFCTNF